MTTTTRRPRGLVVVLFALTVAALAALATVAAPPARATDPDARPAQPVPWRWWDGGAYQLMHGMAAWPGLNDDTCRPSARHPEPVILLHGTGATGPNNWATVGQALMNEGYCVWAPTFGGFPGLDTFAAGMLSVRNVAAPHVAAEIDRVRTLTGAEKVHLVGMSQGTIVAGYVTKVLRPDAVRTVVGLAGGWPSRKPEVAALVPPGTAEAMRALPAGSAMHDIGNDSDMSREWLGADGSPFVPGVRYLLVASRYDGLVPEASALAPYDDGPERLLLQDGCEVNRSSHLTLYADPRAVDAIVGALDPSDTRPLRCVPTDGITGVLGPVPPR